MTHYFHELCKSTFTSGINDDRRYAPVARNTNVAGQSAIHALGNAATGID